MTQTLYARKELMFILRRISFVIHHVVFEEQTAVIGCRLSIPGGSTDLHNLVPIWVLRRGAFERGPSIHVWIQA